jgi:FkbM family methyltransferase
MLEGMQSRLAPGDLVVDTGAHSVDLAPLCACRVIAFEPQPEAFAVLCESVCGKGVSARVEARCCEVGADDGFVYRAPIESERFATIRCFRDEMAGRQAARTA